MHVRLANYFLSDGVVGPNNPLNRPDDVIFAIHGIHLKQDVTLVTLVDDFDMRGSLFLLFVLSEDDCLRRDQGSYTSSNPVVAGLRCLW